MSRIRIVERTGSTNADLLTSTKSVEGDWLVALAQEAGRGRQGREWRALRGNFFGSTVVELHPTDPPAPSLSLAAGLALIEAVDAAAPKLALQLKWPNDLMLGSKKVAGILLERNGQRVVAGFGVNLGSAPQLPDRATASLGGAISPQGFAPLIAASFAQMLALWRSANPSDIARAWLARAHPLGTLLTVHVSADDRLTGAFDGIDPDGALRLRTGTGTEIIRAGDVRL